MTLVERLAFEARVAERECYKTSLLSRTYVWFVSVRLKDLEPSESIYPGKIIQTQYYTEFHVIP